MASQSPYQTLRNALLNQPHIFLSLPTSPAPIHIPQKSQASTQPTISSLSLHPALETTLHLLNNDLPSAHFLCRHAQAAPAFEYMYLHGILHRIEGDVDNARAWYGNVEDSEVLKVVWSKGSGSGTDSAGSKQSGQKTGKDAWAEFLDRIERWRDSIKARKGSKDEIGRKDGIDWEKENEELRRISLWELKSVLEFVEAKFGTGQMQDATKEWVQPDKTHADMANAMIVGGEGWRDF